MSTLGNTLRERRQSLGISLEQAADATKIRLRLLEALEEGQYERLPDPGYVRGYISSYARYLDLESVPLISMYRAETGAEKYHELNLPAIGEAVAPRSQQHAVPWRAAVTIALVLAVLSLAVWGVTRLIGGPDTPPPVPASGETSTTPVEGSEQPTTPPPANPSGASAQSAGRPAEKVIPFTLKIAVSANGASWVKVVIDGTPAYEGTLAGGQSKEFEVVREAVVKIGKPSTVTVTRDGKLVTVPEGSGTPSVTLKAHPAP